MKDNRLLREVRAVLLAGLADQGLSSVAVKQSFQPTNQGANEGPTVYLSKIADRRYGFLRRNDAWGYTQTTITNPDTGLPILNPDTGEPITAEGDLAMIHTEIQQYETTLQANAFWIVDPATMSDYTMTASDLANAAAAILQSDATREALRAKGIGMLPVEDVRNPYFVDDKERFEASPSFDFTLTHRQVIISTSPVVVSFEGNFKRV